MTKFSPRGDGNGNVLELARKKRSCWWHTDWRVNRVHGFASVLCTWNGQNVPISMLSMNVVQKLQIFRRTAWRRRRNPELDRSIRWIPSRKDTILSYVVCNLSNANREWWWRWQSSLHWYRRHLLARTSCRNYTVCNFADLLAEAIRLLYYPCLNKIIFAFL